MANAKERVTIEDARLIWRNFKGEKSTFNATGKRECSIVLPEEDALNLQKLGYNVKLKEPREEGDDAFYYITFEARFDQRPPRVVMIAGDVETVLGEDMVEILDTVDVIKADIVITPYDWEVGTGANLKSGRKAFLKTAYVTIDLDPIEAKYMKKAK